MVPKEVYDSNFKGTHMVMAIMVLPVFEDVIVPGSGLNASGEVLIVCDPKSLVRLPWESKTLCGMADLLTVQEGKPWEFCPRNVLIQSMKSLSKEFQLELDVGFEVEFQLFNQDNTPLNTTNYCSVTALDQAMNVLDDMYVTLKEMGIKVTQFHKEAAPAQYEFPLVYKPVLEMCDKLLLARTAICAVAMRHKLKASFIPKWSSKAPGNGNHAHISFRKTGNPKNVFPDSAQEYGISIQGQHFMSGILKHLAVLTNFTVPSPNSYTRLVPGCFSGAFVCWGIDNRETPIRLTATGDNGRPTNFELKLMDASANPYIAMAAVIAAGMDGLNKKLMLPPPVCVDPSEIPEEERAKRMIARLPGSTGDALLLLETEAGDVFRESFGATVIKLLAAVRRREGEAFDKCSIEEQVQTYLYLY